MAHVAVPGRGSSRTRRERAQLLITIGIVLALALVSLALFLNGIIYAENVGARGADVGGTDARAFVTTAEGESETLLRTANDGSAEFDEQVASLNASLTEWNNQTRLHHTSRAVYASVSPEGAAEGTQIGQDADRPFTSTGGDGNWTLAVNVTARDFVMNVSGQDLEANDTDPFELCISSGGVVETDGLDGDCEGDLSEAEALLIYENADGNITVTDRGGDIECETDEPRARIDFAAGTLNGRECERGDVGEPFDAFDSYDISYVNGDDVEGTYRFVVDDPDHDPGSLLTDPFTSDHYYDDRGVSPYAIDAIWSAEVAVAYENSRIEYGATIEIVPGEIRD